MSTRRRVMMLCAVFMAMGMFGGTPSVQGVQAKQELFKDVDERSWIVKGFEGLRSKFAPPPPLFGSRRPGTRYELAVELSRLIKRVEEIDNAKKPNKLPSVTEEDRANLKRLVAEFKNELPLVGYDVKHSAFRPDSFADVPRSHWAYIAVADLKEKGILVGYPSKTENTFLLPTQESPQVTSKVKHTK